MRSFGGWEEDFGSRHANLDWGAPFILIRQEETLKIAQATKA